MTVLNYNQNRIVFRYRKFGQQRLTKGTRIDIDVTIVDLGFRFFEPPFLTTNERHPTPKQHAQNIIALTGTARRSSHTARFRDQYILLLGTVSFAPRISITVRASST